MVVEFNADSEIELWVIYVTSAYYLGATCKHLMWREDDESRDFPYNWEISLIPDL